MTAMQRRKGQSGELEVCGLIRDLTGWDVKRKVRNHAHDFDLEGIPGWAPEVKRHATASRADIRAWWVQAEAQAGMLLPVLFYRANRGDWRAVWPLAVALSMQRADMWRGHEWTCETTVEAWATVARA